MVKGRQALWRVPWNQAPKRKASSVIKQLNGLQKKMMMCL
ncbi:hypothetical protein MC885_020964 [Smutsia gigantea]|nr:hypothetical protein MC885_020964 [Smutsia gigantea]